MPFETLLLRRRCQIFSNYRDSAIRYILSRFSLSELIIELLVYKIKIKAIIIIDKLPKKELLNELLADSEFSNFNV
jgi:hypothetical protein